jgi:hypothetical protein
MLHCNMTHSSVSLQLGFRDLLGDLQFARRNGDLGRLALLVYCDLRHWARAAGEDDLANHSSALISNGPHASRDDFIAEVDGLISELEQAGVRVSGPQSH